MSNQMYFPQIELFTQNNIGLHWEPILSIRTILKYNIFPF